VRGGYTAVGDIDIGFHIHREPARYSHAQRIVEPCGGLK
jgi:hypothetical protein